jgi:hypothetical protein
MEKNIYKYEDFLAYRHKVNPELQKEFCDLFKKIIQQHSSLNQMIVTKCSTKLIKTSNILPLLNKLSTNNQDDISNKIINLINPHNVNDNINEIMKYGAKSHINCKTLINIIESVLNKFEIEDIEEINNYINEFLQFFETDKDLDINTQEYLDFVDRNCENNEIKGKMLVITYVLTNNTLKEKTKYSIVLVYNMLIDRMLVLIQKNNQNITYVLLDCFLSIIKSHELKKNPESYSRFIECFKSSEAYKSLTPKIKFKFLDVFDYIEKIKNPMKFLKR